MRKAKTAAAPPVQSNWGVRCDPLVRKLGYLAVMRKPRHWAVVLGLYSALSTCILVQMMHTSRMDPCNSTRRSNDEVALLPNCWRANNSSKLHEKDLQHKYVKEDLRAAPLALLTMWVYDGYDSLPPIMGLNMKTWRHHNPALQIQRVNDTTIRQFIPDLPDEFFKIYDAAKADVFRAGVLYHQGGFYADTDFIMMRPLQDMVDRLKVADIVSYGDDDECSTHFSSNFMGARKGNHLSEVWWTNVKEKLRRTCSKGDMADPGKGKKVCCREEGDINERKTCIIPWGHLEHLKFPSKDHDGTPVMQLNESKSSRSCLHGDESFHVDGVGHKIFWQTWPYNQKGRTCGRDGVDLLCVETDSNQLVRNFFNRTAMHLFASLYCDKEASEEKLLNSDMLLGYLYRQSLGLPEPSRGAQKKEEIGSTSTKSNENSAKSPTPPQGL
eukprot:scaffold59321_cov36-Attheya_sp.AAC.1